MNEPCPLHPLALASADSLAKATLSSGFELLLRVR